MGALTFGEIMLRLSTPDFRKMDQSIPGLLEAKFGGGEANVSVNLARLGISSSFVTALPKNELGQTVQNHLQQHGVQTDFIHFSPNSRLGIYFVESGASYRGSSVIYDRDASALAKVSPVSFNWDLIMENADWFHITGITPALSRTAFESSLAAVQKAGKKGIPVSIDLNYRKKLWNWDPAHSKKELAATCMRQLLPYAQLVIGNEEDFSNVLGIEISTQDIDRGALDIQAYPQVARRVCKEFTSIDWVGVTLRESISASHNRWGGMVYHTKTDQTFFHPTKEGRYAPYEIVPIIDRIGAGDSFASALIYAVGYANMKGDEACAFAAAASALKHSIPGDFNLVTLEEIHTLASGKTGGRINR